MLAFSGPLNGIAIHFIYDVFFFFAVAMRMQLRSGIRIGRVCVSVTIFNPWDRHIQLTTTAHNPHLIIHIFARAFFSHFQCTIQCVTAKREGKMKKNPASN